MMFRAIALVMAALFLAACGFHKASCALTPSNPLCASTSPVMEELSIPPTRITQKGYSLVPLNEKGWLVRGRNPVQLALGKLTENPDESFVIHATMVKVGPYKTKEDFVRLIKDSQARDTDPQRFKTFKHDVTAYTKNATECARSHSIVEDNAAARASGNKGIMILEVLALSCAHPKDKSVAVYIGFSQRYYAGHRDSAFMDKANTVLSSLEFIDL